MNKIDYSLFLKVLKEKMYENLKDIDITMNSDLKKDLFLDSISFYSLIVSLEQAFKVTFNKVSIDADEFKTVGTMIEYIDSLKIISLHKVEV